MELDDQLQLQALDQACQSLAQRAKLMLRGGQVDTPSRIRKVERIVTNALELLEKELTRIDPETAPSPRPGNTRRLLRMLRGKDTAGEAPLTPDRPAETPPTGAHRLSFRGEAGSIPPPDLLGFLAAQRRTGILEVTTPTEVFTIELEEGDIVHTHVSRTLPEQRLGDLLVASGKVDRMILERVREEFPADRVGEALLRRRIVTHEQLLDALQQQIQLLFNRLFTTPILRFSFWAGPPVHADEGMRLNTMGLILEGARSFDERTLAG